jgi:Short C-terminal domain
MRRRFGPRIAIIVAVLSMVAAGAGFVAMLILNAFVLDEYDAYGEAPIPGSTSLHLPAGEATVSFHTMVTGSPSSGFPIPDLQFSITPPAGVPKPQVTESVGGTTTVNSDTHVQVSVVQIPAEGTYDITTDGKVNGYINPQLAFGHDSSYGWLAWAFAGLFVVGLVELTASLVWAVRSRRAPSAPADEAFNISDSDTVSDPYTATADGIRFEQLRNLAALRDSGALTEDEFQAEKRRILNG